GVAEAGIDGAGGRDVDVAIRRLVDAGRDRRWVVVARLRRALAIDQPARRLEVEHRDLRLEQRRVHPLALPGALALEEGEQDALREEAASREVRDRNTDAHGALAGEPGDGHEAAEALRDLVDAGAVGVGPVLPEAGDAPVDDARVH